MATRTVSNLVRKFCQSQAICPLSNSVRSVQALELSVRGFSSNTNTLPRLTFNAEDYDIGNDITIIRESLKDIVGSQKAFSDGFKDREKLLDLMPKSQEELPAKTIKEGLQVAWLRLSNPEIRERYINFMQNVRIGRILELLDTYAVWTSFMHNKPAGGDIESFKSPLVIVTAMVDQIDIGYNLDIAKDIRMLGYVSWVGKTSMEITMMLQQEKVNGTFDTALEARFLMVARDPLNRGAAFVAPLKPDGPEEEAIFSLGEQHKLERQKESKQSLLKTSPSLPEYGLVHNMWKETLDAKQNSFKARVKPENAVWMEDTILKNILINHPQQRNLYNKIFGGHLMREAFELAWSNAVRYCKQRPNAVSIDDIIFQRPVEVGTLLFMSSQVVYTKDSFMQIRVHAEVVKPTEEAGETSNVFYFTFGSADGKAVPMVFPKTYAENMSFIDGKRHFESVMGVS